MINYIIRRLLLGIPVLLGVSIITFSLMHIGSADPARIMMGQRGDATTLEQIRKELDLDKDVVTQYFLFLKKLFTGTLTSYKQKLPVIQIINEKIWYTLLLAFSAVLISVILGISMGVVSAVKQNTWLDKLAMGMALLGISAPVYLVGLIIILVFVKELGWIPDIGYWDSYIEITLANKYILEIFFPICLILPAITLGVRPAAELARMTRSSMLEIIRQDYIKTARAKGLTEKVVVVKHALRNAMIPIVTIIGMQFASLLSGAVLTETIFSWPGLQRTAVQALNDRDYPLIEGSVLFTAFIFVGANLLVDLSYSLIDPRVKYD